ncbi:MAG TPA: protein-disulfide reductase DsbD N-terminal domain-containing protein [Candidatus Acidoferrales bacterium]|nr:protein-disulfide reductase DsbD N-terminal domain-containing protein [Candidatus Acidoferrales bacterium]
MKIRRLRGVRRNASVAIKVVLIISALLLLSRVGVAQEQTPSARDVVSPSVYVSADPAARGVPFQVAVVFKIRPGFHVNAREKSADYLIATDLRAEMPAGFKAGEVAYPKGQLHSFTFSKTPLNVYEGTVTLRMPVTALASAPTGPQQIPLKLRYQACSTAICLPPVTIDLQASINVVASAAAAKPAHPELFPSP